jgi:hypothetical protein
LPYPNTTLIPSWEGKGILHSDNKDKLKRKIKKGRKEMRR